MKNDDAILAELEALKTRIAALEASAGLVKPAAGDVARAKFALGLATGTSIPRHWAIKILRAMTKDLSPGAGGDPGLRVRMAALNQPDIGAGDARPAPNLAEMVVAAYNKTLGKT